MVADTMVIIERMFAQPQEVLFDAFTQLDQMAQWRGSPGWHVEREGLTSDLRTGGRHHHVKVLDADPATRVTTDAVFTEFFRPDVFVAIQQISGDAQIDPTERMELRVEFLATGRRGTLVRIIQGPYQQAVAGEHSTGWERELERLAAYLEGSAAASTGEARP